MTITLKYLASFPVIVSFGCVGVQSAADEWNLRGPRELFAAASFMTGRGTGRKASALMQRRVARVEAATTAPPSRKRPRARYAENSDDDGGAPPKAPAAREEDSSLFFTEDV